MLMEPINTRDIPCFFLDHYDHAHQIVGLVGAVNLAVRRPGWAGCVSWVLKISLPSYNQGEGISLTMVDCYFSPAHDPTRIARHPHQSQKA